VTGVSYSRRRDHVVALALSGLKRGQIAEELGLSIQAVGRSLSSARKRGLLPTRRKAERPPTKERTPRNRMAEIVRLASEGTPPREIAERRNCAPATVHHYLWKARREEQFTGWFKTGAPREVGSSSTVIPRSLADALRPAAAQRGLTVPEFARIVLARVVEDNLVEAVLDDQDETEGRAHV
jgi:DNA-binding CsgD family transcriptional regulator